MKPKYKHQTGGYGGCMASGLKFGFLVVVITCIILLFSCASTKEGCGTENYRKAFNK